MNPCESETNPINQSYTMIRYLKEEVQVVVGRERQGGRREGEKEGGKRKKNGMGMCPGKREFPSG